MIFHDQELLYESKVKLRLDLLSQVKVHLQSRYFRMQWVDAVLDCCSQRDVVDDDASFLCSCIYNLQAETLSIEQIFVIELSFIFNSFVVGVRVVLNEL